MFSGKPLQLAAERFDRLVFDRHAGANLPLLVNFWAAWCSPCRVMASVFDTAAKDYEPRLRFAQVDIDAEPQRAARWNARSIPTLILFRAGREIARLSGAVSAGRLHEWIEDQLFR